MHIEFFVEEESCAEALKILVPRIIGTSVSFGPPHSFQGKTDLLKSLPARLQGCRHWFPDDWRIVVVIDRDDDNCVKLKAELDEIAVKNGFATRKASRLGGHFEVLNRIAVEELEAWFFGDVEALVQAYPRVPPNLAQKSRYRDPDAIKGGAWESLERVLQQAGYYRAGMPKIEVARNISRFMNPDRNRSHSFGVFCAGLRTMIA